MIITPEWARPTINVVYPAANFCEFERWYFEHYEGDVSDREYLPIFYCGYQVNNNYGQDKSAMQRLQEYVDTLPNDKKYFTISQYDDGIGVDWKGKDVLEFNMSKVGENKYPLPLIGQPHPYKFSGEKKYLANFVGSLTHPIREHAKTLIGKEGYYISFDVHTPYGYCKIISESIFTLCYRGYGISSFRIAEALQYGSIPVYISDEFIIPHKIPFNEYGVMIEQNELYILNEALRLRLSIGINEHDYYQEFYTYEGTKDKILKHLLTLK